MDIKHHPHKHPDGTDHKTIRVYYRKKNGKFYNYTPIGFMCKDCGVMVVD